MIPSITSSLLAFGFANLIALGWLGAAAAPILIHLWMRQTHRTTAWAAVRFLQAALERQARRLKLQHWILLAIRTAILLLVALAAAKPFLDQGLLTAGGTPTHRILLFDTSHSMNYGETRQSTRLDEAKRLAVQLIDKASSADRFTLLSVSSAVPATTNQTALDRQAALAAVKRIESTSGTSDPMIGFAAADRIVSQKVVGDATPDRTEVIFFTDLAYNSWEAFVVTDASRETELQDATQQATPQQAMALQTGRQTGPLALVEKLAKEATLTVIDVGADQSPNLAVTRLQLSEALATSGRLLEIQAELSLLNADTTLEAVVELVADGQVLKSETLQLSPERPTLYETDLEFETPGAHNLMVRLKATGQTDQRATNDRLLADNERWLALNLREEVRVLCVEGKRNAARHVADALNPSGEPTSPLQPEIVSDADLSGIELSRFDCVVFCNVPEFGENEAEQIRQYVRAGGGAIFFLGDQVLPSRYEGELSAGRSQAASASLSPSSSGPTFTTVALSESTNETLNEESLGDLLPFFIEEPQSTNAVGLDPLDYAHPIVAPFRGRERAGLLTTPVSRYHPLRLVKQPIDRQTEIALSLGNGSPLIVTSQYGYGKTVVVSTAASLSSIDPQTGGPWTAMPAWPSFLPLVRGMVEAVVGDSSQAASCFVGNEYRNPRIDSTIRLTVRRPDGTEEPVNTSSSIAWNYPRTDQAGIYSIGNAEDFTAAGGEAAWTFAVNIAPSECDLRRIAISTLTPNISVRGTVSAARSVVNAISGNAGLHRMLLFIALALVLTESVLACWFGRGKA